MSKTKVVKVKKVTNERYVHRFENGELKSQVVVEIPQGWYATVREAKLASLAPPMNEEKSSPVASMKPKEAIEAVQAMTETSELEAVIDRDTRKTVSQAAEARLAELIGE